MPSKLFLKREKWIAAVYKTKQKQKTHKKITRKTLHKISERLKEYKKK